MGPRLAPYAVAVVLAAVLAHAGSLSGGFVYDDHRFIEKNPAIASLSNAPKFFSDPSTASAAAGVEPDIYRPLRTLDFAADRALFGLRPFGWHFASVVLHAANAVLVWLLLVRLLGGAPAAGPSPPAAKGADARRAVLFSATAGAVLFAVHPVTVEAVAWVSSRGDLLAWTLVLLALEVLSKPGAMRTALGTALVFLACLAKESAIVAFLLLPLRDAALPAGARLPWKTTFVRAGCLALATAGYLALRLRVLPPAADLPFLAQTGFPEDSRAAALRGMLAGLVWYGRVLAWPFGFPFDRNAFTDPVPGSFADPEAVLGAGLLLSVLAAGVLAWRRGSRVVAFSCLGSLVALIPVSNVVVPLKAMTAERFLYPAMPCLAAGAAYGLLALSQRRGAASRLPLAAGTALVLLVLGALAFVRGVPWRSEASLWSAVRAQDPMNPRAYDGLGIEWMKQGYRSRAERALETYLEFLPWDGKAMAELADVMRGVWHDLAPASEEERAVTDIDRQRSRALGFEIRLRRRAMAAWAAVGLVRGRGSVALLRDNLAAWREAATLFHDFAEAKRANDLLAADDVERWGSMRREEQASRVQFAVLALTPEPPPPDEGYNQASRQAWEARRTAARAALLSDVGVDPSLSDAAAAEAVLPALDALVEERPGDLRLRRARVDLVMGVIHPGVPDARKKAFERLAVRDLEAIVARDRSDPSMARLLQALRASIGEGR